jgi:hypothetical protein
MWLGAWTESERGYGYVDARRRWDPPGWPWELELLAVVFVVTAIVVPYYLQVTSSPDVSHLSIFERAELERRQEATGTWQQSSDFIWAIAIVCLYLAHFVMAGASINFLSTPFTHLFAPLMFSGITYYRLLKIEADAGLQNPIVKGTVLEIAMWVVGVLVITFLVARIRMARHMLRFKDVHWEVTTPTLFDSTFSNLAIRLQPIIYPPRVYRTCDQGIMVEGWLYVMPIPYKLIQSVDRVTGAALHSTGYYLATSTRHLVRVQLTESPEPVFISPRDQAGFLRYCQQHVTAMKPDTRSVETVVEVE